MPIRWNFNDDFSFSNQQFARIYRFFVVETPVDDVSQRGISFKQRGWNLNSLNAALKRSTAFLKTNWVVSTAKDAENQMKAHKIFDSVRMPIEIAIHTTRNDSNTVGLFYSIRCAFAHGAFSIHTCNGEKYYMLENKDKGIYKGRIVIKESSLISIIDTVESEPPKRKEKKKAVKKKEKKKKELLPV